MNSTGKIVLVVLTVIYVVSPIDALPGPMDDLLVMLVTVLLTQKKKTIE